MWRQHCNASASGVVQRGCDDLGLGLCFCFGLVSSRVVLVMIVSNLLSF